MLKHTKLRNLLVAIVAVISPLLIAAPAVFAVTPAPTLTTPAASTTYGAHIPISFTLPVAPLANSVHLLFVGGTTYNVTLNTSTSGTTSFTLDNTNLSLNAQFQSVAPVVSKVPDGTYTVVLSYQDAGADPAASASSTNVTLDSTVPTTSSVSPTNNQTNVALNSALIVNFSKAVAAGTGSIVISKVSDSSVFESIAVGSGQVAISGSQVTITPSTAFAGSTAYSVNVPAGAFQDLFGNAAPATTWQFTTAAAPVTTTTTITTPQLTDTGFNAAVSTVAAFVLIGAAVFVRFRPRRQS